MIWRGRHVGDPTELSQDEASAYFDEVLRVRAIEQQYRPIKMNFEPLQPAHFMRVATPGESQIPEQTYARELAALRELLRD